MFLLIHKILIRITFYLLLISTSLSASTLIELSKHDKHNISESGLWHKVKLPDEVISLTTIKNTYNKTSATKGSTITTSGSYIAEISLINKNDSNKVWFVILAANFIDTGIAFLEKSDGTVISEHDFSQLNDLTSFIYMHGQTFSISTHPNESYSLWIFVQAKIYASPLSINLLNKQSFSHNALLNNAITVTAIAIMLTLSLVALMSYFNTRNLITLACSAYIGLHGVGWMVASGLLNDIFSQSTINFTYWGILIYPFAIAAASQYTKLLFDCDKTHYRLATLLNQVSIICCISGVLLPFITFSTAFLISHLIASIWITLCIAIGLKMLSFSNNISVYYLLGNTCYAVSTGLYVLSHTQIIQNMLLPELWVVIALAFDCVCILLSLFSWLYHHPKHNPVYRPIT